MLIMIFKNSNILFKDNDVKQQCWNSNNWLKFPKTRTGTHMNTTQELKLTQFSTNKLNTY